VIGNIMSTGAQRDKRRSTQGHGRNENITKATS
jgi:hypothetical protein